MYVGMRVEISGLNSRPELNGQIGKAVSYESAKGRYAVELDGKRIALKATNLSLAADDDDAELTPEDEGLELLECARYGEEDELRQLLAKGVPVNFTDAQGNNGLHRASANGHLGAVKLLAEAGCPHVANESGNFPLHWACQQGHVEVTKALLALFPDADVLAQNSFGKSVSSEAFAKGDAGLVEAVLAHSSAAKLDPEHGTAMEGVEDSPAQDGMMEAEATHAFRFGGEGTPVVKVRELGELGADDPSRVLGTTMCSDEDRTGLQLWAASIVLSRWLVELAPRLRGRGVVELGAGCGLCGIVAAKLCGASPVIMSDLADETMANMRHNLELNGLAAPGTVTMNLDWRDRASYPPAQPLVIGADLVYAREAVTPLTAAIDALVAPGGAFLYVCPETNRLGEAEFLQRLCLQGFECQQSPVPPGYLANAFAPPSADDEEGGGTDEDFYVLFSELQQRTYTLYCYTRIGDVSLPPLPEPPTQGMSTMQVDDAPVAPAAPAPPSMSPAVPASAPQPVVNLQ